MMALVLYALLSGTIAVCGLWHPTALAHHNSCVESASSLR